MVDPARGRGADSAGGALLRRLNGVLDPDLRVRRIAAAPTGFDARFSAVWRRYAYRIADRAEAVDPLRRSHVLVVSQPLDEAAMAGASEALLGEHDFAAFCRKRPGATTIRTLLELGWERQPDGLLVGTVRADAFCHNMVRALVGCLWRSARVVGTPPGRRASWPAAARPGGDRRTAARAHPRGGRLPR